MTKCNHAYAMIYDDDFCACESCGETWELKGNGWVSSKRAQYYKTNNKFKSFKKTNYGKKKR